MASRADFASFEVLPRLAAGKRWLEHQEICQRMLKDASGVLLAKAFLLPAFAQMVDEEPHKDTEL